MKQLLLGLVATAAFALPVAAQTVVADTDGDGVFSMTELQAAYPDLTAESFTAIDVDASGSIDADELQAAIEGGQLPA